LANAARAHDGSVVGIPSAFDLLIEGEAANRPCKMVWHAQNRIGIEFSR
jgi:hypothetical protein